MKKGICFFLSLAIVAFGQPAFSSVLAMASSLFGFALFFFFLLEIPEAKKRFWMGCAWFTSVQLIQLSWFISHPYFYIYPVWFLLSFVWGLQFGLIAWLVTKKRVQTVAGAFMIASIWTLLEWSRLFLLSGHSWNPSGLALAGNLYSMQTASLVGAYGMSFWVMLINLFLLRVWMTRTKAAFALFALFAASPFLFGFWQVEHHREKSAETDTFSALLVQTSFPIEEVCQISNLNEYVIGEWRQILSMTAPHKGKKIDLIALPEFVVPYGAYSYAYSYEVVQKAFVDYFGEDAIDHLPELDFPLAHETRGQWLVSNAYWAQALANQFNTALITGMEDIEDDEMGLRHYYSAALFFEPRPKTYVPQRYSKQILVPLGEYIPFSFCRELAKEYGVLGSFTPGTCPSVFNAAGVPFGVSICYEETFGDLMRKNRNAGAGMLINVSNDAWYPNSRLIWQHLEHARLRTVESGIPLLRACNTGITGAFDAFGRTVSILAEDAPNPETVAEAHYVTFSPYTYQTLYSRTGDALILAVSAVLVMLGLFYRW